MFKEQNEFPLIVTMISVLGIFYLNMGHVAVRRVHGIEHVVQQSHIDLDTAEHELDVLQPKTKSFSG